jgi:predicted HAD superfamily phosphohydrolase
LFCRFGKEKALEALQSWSNETLKNSGVDVSVLKQLLQMYPDALPKAKIITDQNMEILIKESSAFRKKVRGVAVGKLG